MKRVIIIGGSVVVVVLLIVGFAARKHQTTTHLAATSYPLVSLGDSVAAGDGLPEIPGGMASLCHQSKEAYPYVLAQLLHSSSLHQFACSGAQVNEGILGAQTIGTQNVAPQLQSAKPYLRDSNVIITIGANDVGWSNLLLVCAQTSCSAPSNLSLFQTRLTAMEGALNTLLSELTPLHPHAVLLNTYYGLISTSDNCVQQFGITNAKIDWINAREAALNNAIIAAARSHHDRYAKISFGDHDICSQSPWIQGLSGSAPLHPTADGQATIASYDQAKL